MITFETKGSFKKTESFLHKVTSDQAFAKLDELANLGTQALIDGTPKDTTLTANSWRHKVSRTKRGWQIIWYNVREEDGIPIAILLQYGHATGTGGYVQGRDYINPAMKPVFDKIANDVWKEVVRK